MTLETYLAFVATVLVFFAHPPGPGRLLFMSHAARAGVGRALPVILGNHAANVLQMIAAGFGLAGAIAASGEVFLAVKWFGVAYLLWLGARSVLGAGRTGAPVPARGSLARQGFVTAAANPFAILFFGALFPQFIDPTTLIAPQIAILGVTYLVIDGAILLALGATAHRLVGRIGRRFERLAGRVAGALMIAAAVLLALRGTEAEPRAEAP